MSTRNVEIEDTLQECVDSAIAETKQELLSYLDSNPDLGETPDIGNDLNYSGAIHEIIDGSVPIYTKEITDTMYLHGNKINEAFDNAGVGSRDDKCWPMGWEAAAIYCYIEQEVNAWYQDNGGDIFDEWKEAQDSQISDAGTARL